MKMTKAGKYVEDQHCGDGWWQIDGELEVLLLRVTELAARMGGV
jgi:hypothetical protein